MINKIKARCEIAACDMTENQINFLIKKYKGAIINIAKEFYKKNNNYYWKDIYSVAQEGFYMAIKAYDPCKGKLITYAYFYCRAWMKHYLNKAYRHIDREIVIPLDYFKDTDVNIEDKVFINEIFSVLTKTESEVLSIFMNGISKSNLPCEVKTRYKFETILNKTINKIKEMCNG